MALSEHVSITITSANVAVQRQGFGVPLILSCNAAFSERVRQYSSIEEVAVDFASTTPEYLAANAFFSQEPAPEQVMIGRAVGKPTMRYQMNIQAVTTGATYRITASGPGITTTTVTYTPLADITFTAANASELFTSASHGMSTGDGPYRVSNSGGALPSGLFVDTDYWVIADVANGVADPVNTFQLATSKANALTGTELLIATDGTGTQTLRRSQNDVIVAQFLQGLNAVVGKNYTAVTTTGAGETDYLVITGDAAGNWFSLEPNDVSLLKLEQTHAEPGTTIASDLTAIRAANDAWYMLYTLYNSDACVKAAAAAIESASPPKIYGADLSLTETASLADGGGDTADDLQTLNYDRTFVTYHPSPYYMAGAAWAGSRLPYNPGAATWKFASPAGVPAVSLTSTHTTNLVAKNANFLQTTAGVNIMREGVMVGGEFIDVIRDLDFLKDDVQKSIFEVIASAAKVPMTQAGILLIVNALRGSLTRAFNLGIIDSDFTITYPQVLSISANNRALRILPDIKFSCRLQGAVHKVQVTGVISV